MKSLHLNSRLTTLTGCLLLASLIGCSDDGAATGEEDAGPGDDDGDASAMMDSSMNAVATGGTGSGGTGGMMAMMDIPPLTEAECASQFEATGGTISEDDRTMCTTDVAVDTCNAQAECYCNNCICLLGACGQDAACSGIIACAGETGCQDQQCFIDNLMHPACTGLISWSMDAQGNSILNGLVECIANNSCGEGICDADGGVEDAG